MSRQKTYEKKISSSFSDRHKLEFNDGQPWLTNRMGANFFLWKYLILSYFHILKTPTEDSILCHKRDFIHHFFIKGAFACLLHISKKKKIQNLFNVHFVPTWLIRWSNSLKFITLNSSVLTFFAWRNLEEFVSAMRTPQRVGFWN